MSQTPKSTKKGATPSSSSALHRSHRQPKTSSSSTSINTDAVTTPPATVVASRPLGTTTSPSSSSTSRGHHQHPSTTLAQPFQHLFSHHHPTVPHQPVGGGRSGHHPPHHHHNQHLSITIGEVGGSNTTSLSSSSLAVDSSAESPCTIGPLHSIAFQHPHHFHHHHYHSTRTAPGATGPPKYPHHSYTRHFWPMTDTVPHVFPQQTSPSPIPSAKHDLHHGCGGDSVVTSSGRGFVHHHHHHQVVANDSSTRDTSSPLTQQQQQQQQKQDWINSPSYSDISTSDGNMILATPSQGSSQILVPMLEPHGADSFSGELPLPVELPNNNQSGLFSFRPSTTSTLLPPLPPSPSSSVTHNHNNYNFDSLTVLLKVEIRVNSNKLSTTSDFFFPVSRLTSPGLFMRQFMEPSRSGKMMNTTSPLLGGNINTASAVANRAAATNALLTPVGSSQMLGSQARSSGSAHLPVSPTSDTVIYSPDMSHPAPGSSTLERSNSPSYRLPHHESSSFEVCEFLGRNRTTTSGSTRQSAAVSVANNTAPNQPASAMNRHPPALNTRARFLMNSLDCCRPLLSSSGTSELRFDFRVRSLFVVPRWAYDIVLPKGAQRGKINEDHTVLTPFNSSHTIPQHDPEYPSSPTLMSSSTPPLPLPPQQLPPYVQLNNDEKCAYVTAMKAIKKSLKAQNITLRQANSISKKEAAMLRNYRLSYIPSPIDVRQWLPSCFLTVDLPSVLHPFDGCNAPPATPLHRTTDTTPKQTTTAPNAATTMPMTPPPQQLVAPIPDYLPATGPYLSRSPTPVATHTSTTTPCHDATSESLDTSERHRHGDHEYSCEDDLDAVRSALSFETHKAAPISPPAEAPPITANIEARSNNTSTTNPFETQSELIQSPKKGIPILLGPLTPHFTVSAVTISNPATLRKRLRSQPVGVSVSEGFLNVFKIVCLGGGGINAVSVGGSPTSLSQHNNNNSSTTKHHPLPTLFHPVSSGSLEGSELAHPMDAVADHQPQQPHRSSAASTGVRLTSPNHSPSFATFAPLQNNDTAPLSPPASEGLIAASSRDRFKPTSVLPYHQRLFIQHLLEIIRQESSFTKNNHTAATTTTSSTDGTTAERHNKTDNYATASEFGGFRQYSHSPSLKTEVYNGTSSLKHTICRLSVVLSSSELKTSFTDASRMTTFSMANLALVFMHARALPFFEFAVCHLTPGHDKRLLESILDLVPTGYHTMSLNTCFNPSVLPQTLDFNTTSSSSISNSDSTTTTPPVDQRHADNYNDSEGIVVDGVIGGDELPTILFGKSPMLPPLLVKYGMPDGPTNKNIDHNNSASVESHQHHGLMRGVPTTSDVEECEEDSFTVDESDDDLSSTEGASSTRHDVRPSPPLSGYHSRGGGGSSGITSPFLNLTPSGSLQDADFSCDSDVVPKQHHHHHHFHSHHQQHDRFRATRGSKKGGGSSSSRGVSRPNPLAHDDDDYEKGDGEGSNTSYTNTTSTRSKTRRALVRSSHRLLCSNSRIEEALYIFLSFMIQVGNECGIWAVVYTDPPTPPHTEDAIVAATTPAVADQEEEEECEGDTMGERQISTTSTALPPSSLPPPPPPPPPGPPPADSTDRDSREPPTNDSFIIYVNIASRVGLRSYKLSRKQMAIAKRIRAKCFDALGEALVVPAAATVAPAAPHDDDGEPADVVIIVPYSCLPYFKDFIDFITEVTSGAFCGYTEVPAPATATPTMTTTANDERPVAVSYPVSTPSNPTDRGERAGTLYDASFWQRTSAHSQQPTVLRGSPLPATTVTDDNDHIVDTSMRGADDSTHVHLLDHVNHTGLSSELVASLRRARRRVREFERLILGLILDPHWEVVYDPWHPVSAVMRPELGTTTAINRTPPSTQPSHPSTNFSQSSETDPGGILSPRNPQQHSTNHHRHRHDPIDDAVAPVGLSTFQKRPHHGSRVFVPHPGPSSSVSRGRGSVGDLRGRSGSLSALSSCSTVLTTGQNSVAGGGSSTTASKRAQ